MFNKRYIHYKKHNRQIYTIIIFVLSIMVFIGLIFWWQNPAYSPPFLQSISGLSDLDETPINQNDIDIYTVSADKPRLLIIPKINIKSRIFEVGLTPDNAIDTTKGIFDVGWYTGSAIPGQKDVAFLDGHVSGPNNKGIFFDLKKLNVGDEIIVEMGNGQNNTFIVQAVEEKKLEEVDMAKALRPIDSSKPGLNLMTCAGKFNKSEDTFTDRFIVYSALK